MGQTKTHWLLSDAKMETLFATQKLPTRYFDHEAHLRLAWIHVSQYGAEQAEQNLCQQIKDYAISLGVPEKYNETVTIASVRIIDAYCKASGETTFEGLLACFPELTTNFKEIIARCYSTDVFRSPEAKKAFVEPDLKALGEV